MELDSMVAAKWCRKHKVPSVPPEVESGLLNFSKVLYQAICDSSDITPPEIRVYYQSMKFILRVVDDQARFPERQKAGNSREKRP